MAGDATRVRVVLQFDREPDPKWFLLARPAPAGHRPAGDRLFVVDPKST